jgi:hypothetical protein
VFAAFSPILTMSDRVATFWPTWDRFHVKYDRCRKAKLAGYPSLKSRTQVHKVVEKLLLLSALRYSADLSLIPDCQTIMN